MPVKILFRSQMGRQKVCLLHVARFSADIFLIDYFFQFTLLGPTSGKEFKV